MIADKILSNIYINPSDKKTVKVSFEWFELEKKRLSKTAEDGTEIGVCISERIKSGDVIGETEDTVYAAEIVPCRLIKIHVETMQEMGRLGFELGNRHLSLQINDNEVRVPFDSPTFEYLRKLGFKVEDVTERFDNFIECKAHGHSHTDGEHSHSHKHE